MTNAEIEAIRERLEEASEAAEKARAEEAETHQKLLDFQAAHAAAVEDAAASARADGVAAGVKLGMRKAADRARAEGKGERREGRGARAPAMEANVAAARRTSPPPRRRRRRRRASRPSPRRALRLWPRCCARRSRRGGGSRRASGKTPALCSRRTQTRPARSGSGRARPDDPDAAAVWVTAQVPTNSGKPDLRDHLLPELVEIASWGSADVTEDDFALVRSHFVLIGGLILPHPAEGARGGATALLDINLLCKGIAADLRVPSEEVHCYRNGTVSASPPVIAPSARDARAAEDYEATAADEHALQTRALAETVVNASRVVSAWTDPARTPGLRRPRPTSPSAEDMLTGAFAQFTETVGVGKLGAAYDPNVPRDGDYTFDGRSPAAAAAVEGEVVVFIVTGEKDQSDFMDLVARTDLHQYASGAAFKTTEAMIGGRARAAVRRGSTRLRDGAARWRWRAARAAPPRGAVPGPAAQKHLSAAMGGRSLLRDVKIKKEPRVAFEAETAEHVDANVTETRTDAIWNDPLSASASAAMGARPSRDARVRRARGRRRKRARRLGDVPGALRRGGGPRRAAPRPPVPGDGGDCPGARRDGRRRGRRRVRAFEVCVSGRAGHAGALARFAPVGVVGACAALAADLAVPGDALDCFLNGTVAVPAGAATNEYMGNHSWTALSFAVHGRRRTSGVRRSRRTRTRRRRERELNLPTVAAMCGGNTPALLSREHHAFVTYAVAAADRAEADAVMRALKSKEAAQFTARALRVGDGARVAVRDVIYKTSNSRRAARERMTRRRRCGPTRTFRRHRRRCGGGARRAARAFRAFRRARGRGKVLVTVAAPTDAVSSPGKAAAEKAREAQEAWRAPRRGVGRGALLERARQCRARRRYRPPRVQLRRRGGRGGR